ncbi:MAG: ROK family protein [Rhodothermaceae bacterium]
MAKTKVTLGIDIGGTNTVFGLVTKDGECLHQSGVLTLADKPAGDLFNRLFEKFHTIFDPVKDQYELCGAGIGAPNTNYYTGQIVSPPNFNWKTENLTELLKKYIDLPVAVTNDANAAALGEKMFGNGRGLKNFIEITLGTGLGSGIVVNDEILYGSDGFAGELGHITAIPDGRICGCGKKGCLETYASATGITRTVYELLSESSCKSKLRSVSFADLTSKMIYEMAKDGDEIALKAFDRTAKILGRALADAVAVFSPEAFILFGGLANAGDLLLKPTKKYMEENLLQVFKNKVKILQSGLEASDVAIIGAAALIWNEI